MTTLEVRSRDAWRQWLCEHHASESGIWLVFHKRHTAQPSVSYNDAVDEALCFGWIDSIRRSLPNDAWSQRLTPRRKGSNWSAVNVANVERLRAEGRMRPAGEAAFALRSEARTGIYSYEQRHEARLTEAEEAAFRSNVGAWTWWEAQSKAFRAMATYWVVSAKRPETRARRLATVIEDAAAGLKPKPLRPIERSSVSPGAADPP